MTTTASRMFQRRDTTTDWTSTDPVLGAGELAVELDNATGEAIGLRIGDGVNVWSALAEVIGAGGGGGVSDTAYDATSWNGVTDIAPSKNAVRDKVESLTATVDANTVATRLYLAANFV